ncbi:MAG: aldose epimerase family protein [Bacteroidota bacterium]|nr:aldose epimerase family protein [Bacteroidota bacterium]
MKYLTKKLHATLLLNTCIISVCLFTYSCKNKEIKTIDSSTNQPTLWGEVDGKKVYLFTLTNDKGTKIVVSNYGGVMTKWITKDKNGNYSSILLGFDSLKTYQRSKYFGALIGRFGNRIGKAQFNINDVKYALNKNDGENFLHGGKKGFDKVVWNYQFNEDSANAILLTYDSPDMEEGFPGNLSVSVKFTLNTSDELLIEYWAETDKPTVVNLTQHNYFNLTGDPTKTILDHKLKMNSVQYTPVDSSLIPTGEIKNALNTPFDFSSFHTIGERIGQIKGGYDHNWVVQKELNAFDTVAIMKDSISGRILEILSTEPGLQFYSGNFLNGTDINEQGIAFNKYTGLCLETQHFPDSPNHANFPSTLLLPNQKYYSKSIYKVTVE